MKNLKTLAYHMLRMAYLPITLTVFLFTKLPITRREKVYALLLINLFVYSWFNNVAVAAGIDLVNEYKQKPIIIERTVEVEKVLPPEPSMKEWVRTEIEKAGLSWTEVDCLIRNESGWNQYAYGINTNGSTDFGLWQWNSLHKEKVSVECRWDYKCATKKAIEKRLHDGNWSAWYGFNKCK